MIHNDTGCKEITCLQSRVDPSCGEAGVSEWAPLGRGRLGSAVWGRGTAPGLVAVSGALGQGLGSFPAWGGQMEIALELFIYLYATMFQKGFKEA